MLCTKETALRQWGGRHGPWPMALAAQGLVGWAQWAGAKANEGHRRSPLLNSRKELSITFVRQSWNRPRGVGLRRSVGMCWKSTPAVAFEWQTK